MGGKPIGSYHQLVITINGWTTPKHTVIQMILVYTLTKLKDYGTVLSVGFLQVVGITWNNTCIYICG